MNNTVNNNKSNSDKSTHVAPANHMKGFLGSGQEEEDNNEPIADLFPHCTIMFANVAGFMAWSSTREPAQVFVLLQTLYQAFDVIAKRRKVFKVETIGDSYVAVTSLPDVQPNHAISMARYVYFSKFFLAFTLMTRTYQFCNFLFQIRSGLCCQNEGTNVRP